LYLRAVGAPCTHAGPGYPRNENYWRGIFREDYVSRWYDFGGTEVESMGSGRLWGEKADHRRRLFEGNDNDHDLIRFVWARARGLLL